MHLLLTTITLLGVFDTEQKIPDLYSSGVVNNFVELFLIVYKKNCDIVFCLLCFGNTPFHRPKVRNNFSSVDTWINASDFAGTTFSVNY